MSIRIIWSTMIPKSNIWYGKIFSKSLLCKRLVVSFWRQCHGIFLALQCSTNVDFAWIQFLLVPQDQCLLMDAYPLDWESLWAFVPIVCASVGICITLDVVAVFIIYNRYPLGLLLKTYLLQDSIQLQGWSLGFRLHFVDFDFQSSAPWTHKLLSRFKAAQGRTWQRVEEANLSGREVVQKISTKWWSCGWVVNWKA